MRKPGRRRSHAAAFARWGGKVLMVMTLPSAVAAAEKAVGGLMLAKQWRADVEVTSHLVDRSKSYPPWLTRMTVSYDYDHGLARAIIHEGHNAGKIYVRRYDMKREYMVKGGIYPECLRSYLGETMPPPVLPADARQEGRELIDGEACEHWVVDDLPSRVHVYLRPGRPGLPPVPRRLTDTQVEANGEETPLMSYDFHNVELGPQDISKFDVPSPYLHETCTWFIGGFPYLHVFHHYVRF